MKGRKRQVAGGTEEIGARLRSLRKERDLTQSELARQTGIPQPDLSRMEKGEYRVSLDRLFKILAVLGMTVTEFFAVAEGQQTPRPAPLSHDDMQILQLLRRLSPDARREAREFIEFKFRKELTERRSREAAEGREQHR